MFEAMIFIGSMVGYMMLKEFEAPEPEHFECTYDDDEDEVHSYEQ